MSDYSSIHNVFCGKYHHIVDVIVNSETFAKELFMDDATFVIGNFPISKGHEQIRAGCQQIYDMVVSLKHAVSQVYSVSREVYNYKICNFNN